MEKILTYIERFYNSIMYNGFYIILSFLFPFVIYKLDTGHEIIENILGNYKGLNISLIMLSFFLLSFSVWCVPTIAIKIWKLVTKNQTKDEVLYKYLTTIYGGSGGIQQSDCSNKDQINLRLQIPIKYFAVFPWVLFIFTCVQIFSYYVSTIIAVLFLIVMFVLIDKNIKKIETIYSNWLFKKKGNLSEGGLMLRYFGFIIIFLFFTFLPAIIDLIIPKFLANSFIAPKFLIGINYLQLFSFYTFISYLEVLGPKIDVKTQFKISSYSYKFVFYISILLIFALFIINRYYKISIYSPIFVSITIVAVLIMLFDIFFTSQLLLSHIVQVVKSSCKNINCELKETSEKRLRIYRVIIYLSIIGFIYFIFFHSLNAHKIIEVETATSQPFTDKRLSIDNYFKEWLYANHKIKDSTDTEKLNKPLEIYLISGPGGGSRAAVWFYLNMKNLDSIYEDKFYKNIFAISTVSGSTSGANMFLADKYIMSKKKNSRELAKKIYSKNYFSSSFFGLLLGDGIEGILGNFNYNTKDRNYYFQKEEKEGFNEAYETKNENLKKANAYFENDIIYPYKNHDFPLFLINTSIIEYGKRGIFSPVKTNSFSFGIDLYDKYTLNHCTSCEFCNHGYGLPMITCVNQSQSFPIINAYNYLAGAGRLCDGGLYDNSGCTTTLEVYQTLKKYIKNNNLTKIKIVCINIINGKINNDFTEKYSPASILNTFTAAASTPFSGHESYAFLDLERQIENHNFTCKSKNNNYIADTVITIQPQKKYNLTRMLSKKAIDSMYVDMLRAQMSIQKYFNKIKVEYVFKAN